MCGYGGVGVEGWSVWTRVWGDGVVECMDVGVGVM